MSIVQVSKCNVGSRYSTDSVSDLHLFYFTGPTDSPFSAMTPLVAQIEGSQPDRTGT